MSIVESLKRLFDPAAARQEEGERRAAREQPVREDDGPSRWFECRVCGHHGPEPTFCPICLAGTMRPSRAPAPVEALPGASAATAEPEATELPFDGTLDLHTFAPKEVKDLLPEYLAGCQERGLSEVRVVHGKGTGALRRTVQSLLERDPRVASFRAAGEDAGGWGATLVTLKPRGPAPGSDEP